MQSWRLASAGWPSPEPLVSPGWKALSASPASQAYSASSSATSPSPGTGRMALSDAASASGPTGISPGMPRGVKNTTGTWCRTASGPPGGGPTSRGTARRRTTFAGHQSWPSTLAHTALPGGKRSRGAAPGSSPSS
jgi:hypothetical protein